MESQKKYTAELKAHVALEYLSGRQMIEISQAYQMETSLVLEWEAILRTHASKIFMYWALNDSINQSTSVQDIEQMIKLLGETHGRLQSIVFFMREEILSGLWRIINYLHIEKLAYLVCYDTDEKQQLWCLEQLSQFEPTSGLAAIAKVVRYPAISPSVKEAAHKFLQASQENKVTEISKHQRTKVLLLAANPSNMTKLRLNKELKIIEQVLSQSKLGNNFDIRPYYSVQADELLEYLLRHKPDIVHFCGHGTSTSEIVFEDENGNSHPVSLDALSNLFLALNGNTRCVILNACYSELQAKAIARHIDCVISVDGLIEDNVARNFAKALYLTLGDGKDIKSAFDTACSHIGLGDEKAYGIPKLLCERCDPKTIVFNSA